MKRIVALLALVTGLVTAHGQSFTATLDGLQEVPPVPTSGVGFGTLVLNPDNTVTYSISFSGLIGNSTAAHIHRGAVGVPGGVVVGLTGTLGGTSGTLSGTTAPIPAADLPGFLAGNTYVNIHSSFAPGGEIRGQVIPIPEPSTWALFGLGLGAAPWRLRRR